MAKNDFKKVGGWRYKNGFCPIYFVKVMHEFSSILFCGNLKIDLKLKNFSAKEVKHTDSLCFVDGLWEFQFHGERKLESFNAGTGSHRPSDEK